MATPSPSDFLTFSRRLISRPIRLTAIRQPPRTRFLSTTAPRYGTDSSVKTDMMPDDKHTTDKKNNLDPQTNQSSGGKDAHAAGEGGAATNRSGGDATAQAKKEHPEAPDVVIGMQDERGGKGTAGSNA